MIVSIPTIKMNITSISPLRDMLVIFILIVGMLTIIFLIAQYGMENVNNLIQSGAIEIVSVIVITISLLLGFLAINRLRRVVEKTNNRISQFAKSNHWSYKILNTVQEFPVEVEDQDMHHASYKMLSGMRLGQIVEGDTNGHKFKILYITRMMQSKGFIPAYATYIGYIKDGEWQAVRYGGLRVEKEFMEHFFNT
jgi:hypothetical protein